MNLGSRSAYLDYTQLWKDFLGDGYIVFMIPLLFVHFEFFFSFLVGTVRNRSEIGIEALRVLFGISQGIDFVSQLAFHLHNRQRRFSFGHVD